MKNSVELLVILMIIWAVFVVLYNFIGQAFAISDGRNSLKAVNSDVDAESLHDSRHRAER